MRNIFHVIWLLLLLFSSCSQPITQKGFLVEFSQNGGTKLESVRTNLLETFPESERDNYALEGWYSDASLEKEKRLSFPFPVSSDLKLYANWVEATEGLVFTKASEGYAVSGSASLSGKVMIPEYWLGLPIIEIPNNGFGSCYGITYINIPSTIKKIGNWAFDRNHLESIVLPSGLESVGDGAFGNSYTLKSVVIESARCTLGSSVFMNCTGLEEVVMPAAMNSDIGIYAFFSCSKLRTVTIPYGVTSIGDSAFSSCGSLVSVAFPETLHIIGDSAFSGSSALNQLDLPINLWSLGDFCFSGLSNITEITLPLGVSIIGDRSFSSCLKLSSVTSLRKVPPVLNNAFQNCNQINEVIVPKSSLEIYVTTTGWHEYASIITGQ